MIIHDTNEPQLSADFADRVLALAEDRRGAQRRHLHGLIAASAVCVAVVATLAWKGFPTAPQPAAPAASPVLAVGSASLAVPRADTTDPLSYLFPDAEPLARFSAEDGGTDQDTGASALFDEQD
jgi:hypothetical protein